MGVLERSNKGGTDSRKQLTDSIISLVEVGEEFLIYYDNKNKIEKYLLYDKEVKAYGIQSFKYNEDDNLMKKEFLVIKDSQLKEVVEKYVNRFSRVSVEILNKSITRKEELILENRKLTREYKGLKLMAIRSS